MSYRLPAARILGGCEVPDKGGWEMNLGPLQEQQMLLKRLWSQLWQLVPIIPALGEAEARAESRG